MGKLFNLPTETSVSLSDFLIKVKAAGAGDVIVSVQNFLNAIGGKNYNPYKFLVFRSGSQSISTSLVKIQLNSKVVDTGGNFDATTNYRFTAAVPGYYDFSWACYITAGTKILTALYVNGAEAARGSWNTDNASFLVSTGSIQAYPLNANDYVELWAVGTAGTTVDGTVKGTYLSGAIRSAT